MATPALLEDARIDPLSDLLDRRAVALREPAGDAWQGHRAMFPLA
ncbi:MAG: hypothetical protein ACREO8_09850 [Luteimonas sp.]